MIFSYFKLCNEASCIILIPDTFYGMFDLNLFVFACLPYCLTFSCLFSVSTTLYTVVSNLFTEHPEVFILSSLILNYFKLPPPQPTTGGQPTETPARQEVNIYPHGIYL